MDAELLVLLTALIHHLVDVVVLVVVLALLTAVSYTHLDVYKRQSTFAPSSHTHNYAGSSSAGGAATSANKLSTPRKIGNASFDGTADITLSQMGLNVPVEITKANYLAKKKAGTLNANTYYNVIDEYDSANVINEMCIRDRLILFVP